MKLCPECHANVEGLIDHCDCCGASFDTQRKLFSCGVHDMPECLGLASLSFRILDEMEPENPQQYSDFLKNIVFCVICYPETQAKDKKKVSVSYSSVKKKAKVTIEIDYDDFVFAPMEDKAYLVANALCHGICLLGEKLKKNHFDIDEIEEKAKCMLKRYPQNL